MNELLIGAIGVVVLLVLLVLGMRIAFVAALVGAVGIMAIQGWDAGAYIAGVIPQSLVGTYGYSCIPLFILMGYFAFYSGLSHELYSTARQWLGHLPGGLAIATAAAGTGFAACSGASVASAAVVGKVAIPEMLSFGYDRKLAAGIVAMGGVLACLIPPSVVIVIYGILTEQSIAAVLIAGFLPGIVTALLYAIMIYVRARLNPSLAPASSPAPWRLRFSSLGRVWGVVVLIVIVIGGMYTGIFTPTEAGAAGAFGAFVLTIITRQLNWNKLTDSLLETARSSVMIFAIMVGIGILVRFLTLSGLSKVFADFVMALPVPPLMILIAILLVYFVLGMFMDALSMMMLTLPIFFPVVMGLGFDPIWFGVIVVKMCEICLVSPPVGLTCFVVRDVAKDIPLEDVFRGVIPFLAMEIVVIALLIAFPQIALILPNMMRGG